MHGMAGSTDDKGGADGSLVSQTGGRGGGHIKHGGRPRTPRGTTTSVSIPGWGGKHADLPVKGTEPGPIRGGGWPCLITPGAVDGLLEGGRCELKTGPAAGHLYSSSRTHTHKHTHTHHDGLTRARALTLSPPPVHEPCSPPFGPFEGSPPLQLVFLVANLQTNSRRSPGALPPGRLSVLPFFLLLPVTQKARYMYLFFSVCHAPPIRRSRAGRTCCGTGDYLH